MRRSGLAEEAYTRIRADIMSLAIPPDTRVSVDSLARQLGISQTPIREALSMLEANGLVIRRHFVGYCTASKLTRAQLDQLYEIRQLLEPAAARLAALRMGDDELKALEALAQRMDSHSGESTRASYDRFADEDAEFHASIAKGSGNVLIVESLARLHIHLHLFRLRFHQEVTQEAHREHGRIVNALKRRDAAAAEHEMREHLSLSYQRLARFSEA